MIRFIKKLKEKWETLNDGRTHKLIDIDVYIPIEFVVFFVISLIILLLIIIR